MDRLTHKDKDGKWYIDNRNYDAADRLAAYEDTGLEPEEIVAAENRRHDCNIECLLKKYNEVSDKLKAYQDTGLEPDEIAEHESAYIEITTRTYGPLHQKIGEWLKAEREGRMIVLPCKVGDTVYALERFCEGNMSDCPALKPCWDCDDCRQEITIRRIGSIAQAVSVIDDIGKTVFPTCEEAEAALGGGGDE